MTQEIWQAAIDAVFVTAPELGRALATAKTAVVTVPLADRTAHMLVLQLRDPEIARTLQEAHDTPQDAEPVVLAALGSLGLAFDGVAFVAVPR